MNTYEVIRKADGQKVYSYDEDAPVEWVDFPYADFDHRLLIVPEVPPVEVVPATFVNDTKRQFRDRFTQDEKEGIDEFLATFETMDIPVDIKRRIRSGIEDYNAALDIDRRDPRTSLLLGVFAAFGKIAAVRIEEILNGN